MGSTRVSPNQQAKNRQALRKSPNVDYEGMDPEMQATLQGEAARKLKVQGATNPGSLPGTAVVKKPRKKLGIFGF